MGSMMKQPDNYTIYPAMDPATDHDVEKHVGVGNLLYDETGAVHGETFVYGNSLYARLQRLAGKLNVEQRGIERVPDDERTDTSYVNIGSMVCF
jgi:hypothetical protein